MAGLDGMGMDGPVSRPRTPGAIAAAYEQKMKEKAMNAPEEKGGGDRQDQGIVLLRPNCYLEPSITFPIAFLVVGAAFWASLVGGAISERGMPSADELDKIIISSDIIWTSIAVAMSMIQV